MPNRGEEGASAAVAVLAAALRRAARARARRRLAGYFAGMGEEQRAALDAARNAW